MENRVLAALATLIIVLTAFSISIVSSSLLSVPVSIGSSGTIQKPVAVYGPSEIRGVFVKWLDAGTTWETLASSYEPYGVNWLVGEACGTYFSRSNIDSLNIHNQAYDYIGEGIKAAHAHGMKFTAMMLIGFRGPELGTPDPAIDAVDQNGQLQLWACPVKAKSLILSIVTEVATKYPDLDGFMFDYIRYSTDYDRYCCFCEQCHQRFVADTGLTDTNWRTDVIAGGKYYSQWQEWRVKPITELVRDVHNAMTAINPKLEFSIAAFTLNSNSGGGYWRRWIGQDVATMVSEGYIDMVCPMCPATDSTVFTDEMQVSRTYVVGGAEGKASFVPLIGYLEGDGSDMTPTQLNAIVATSRQIGTDGFIIYRQVPNFVTNYLSQLTNLPIFSMSKLQAQKGIDNATTFAWTTTAATSSSIEYSSSPLFYTQENSTSFKYYQIVHSTASSKVESREQTTVHSLTIPSDGATPIYFMVQCADAYNVLSTPQLIYNPEGNNITRARE